MNPIMAQPDWMEKLEGVLPVFGHRNWIVIADSAYPAHCASGIETIPALDTHLGVLRTVLRRIDGCPHVRALAYIDVELEALSDEDAPGVSEYRRDLEGLLAGRPRMAEIHEQILMKMDEAARRFRVLILKTAMRIPYTSVFLELGCGYWTAESERKLRATLHGISARRSDTG